MLILMEGTVHLLTKILKPQDHTYSKIEFPTSEELTSLLFNSDSSSKKYRQIHHPPKTAGPLIIVKLPLCIQVLQYIGVEGRTKIINHQTFEMKAIEDVRNLLSNYKVGIIVGNLLPTVICVGI